MSTMFCIHTLENKYNLLYIKELMTKNLITQSLIVTHLQVV